MPEENAPQKVKRKPSATKADRLAARIIRSHAGVATHPVKITAKLNGPAAASWKAIQEAKGRLELDDAGILGLLMEAGASTVRQALKAAQPE